MQNGIDPLALLTVFLRYHTYPGGFSTDKACVRLAEAWPRTPVAASQQGRTFLLWDVGPSHPGGSPTAEDARSNGLEVSPRRRFFWGDPSLSHLAVKLSWENDGD